MFVSVVIPTYNRKDSLRETLTSLARQTWPADRCEVIVVDDGSTDGTEEIAKEAFPFTLRYIRQPNQGAAVARNRGATEARGKLLLFLDDDITIVPGFLDATVHAHQQYDQVVVVGTLRPVLHGNESIFTEIYSWETATRSRQHGAVFEFVSFTDCLTGMFSVKRDHFFTIGALQDLAGDGRVAWGDVDFGYRAQQLGFQFICCNQAIGYHDDFAIRDLATHAHRWQRASQAAIRLFQTHPEIQSHIPMFHDKPPIAWRWDPPHLIVRKLARHVASSRPTLWGMEQIVSVLEQRYPSPILLRSLYRWIIGGYIFRGYREGLREYGPIEEHG